MADNKFKTAAARLLALHAPKESGEPVKKTEPAAPAPANVVESPPDAPQEKPVIVWKKKGPSSQSVKLPALPPDDYSDRDEVTAPRFLAGRWLLILLPALLGSGIMTVMMPPTIFGIWGNIALGFLAGAALGIIIAKEL